MTETTTIPAPPPGTCRVMSRRDLPNTTALAGYHIIDGDQQRHTMIQKSYRQVLEALRLSPIFCASIMRLSDIVFVLKKDHGVNIETLLVKGDGDACAYGVYVLRSRVIPAGETIEQVAA